LWIAQLTPSIYDLGKDPLINFLIFSFPEEHNVTSSSRYKERFYADNNEKVQEEQ